MDVFSRCLKRWPRYLISALQDKTALRIRMGHPTGVMIDGSSAVDIGRPFGSSDKEVGKK